MQVYRNIFKGTCCMLCPIHLLLISLLYVCLCFWHYMWTSVFLLITNVTITGVYQRHSPPHDTNTRNDHVWPQDGSIAWGSVVFRKGWQRESYYVYYLYTHGYGYILVKLNHEWKKSWSKKKKNIDAANSRCLFSCRYCIVYTLTCTLSMKTSENELLRNVTLL